MSRGPAASQWMTSTTMPLYVIYYVIHEDADTETDRQGQGWGQTATAVIHRRQNTTVQQVPTESDKQLGL